MIKKSINVHFRSGIMIRNKSLFDNSFNQSQRVPTLLQLLRKVCFSGWFNSSYLDLDWNWMSDSNCTIWFVIKLSCKKHHLPKLISMMQFSPHLNIIAQLNIVLLMNNNSKYYEMLRTAEIMFTCSAFLIFITNQICM